MFVSVTVSVMGFVPVVTMWCRLDSEGQKIQNRCRRITMRTMKEEEHNDDDHDNFLLFSAVRDVLGLHHGCDYYVL